jgi:exopolysaccharide production protein ExoQ
MEGLSPPLTSSLSVKSGNATNISPVLDWYLCFVALTALEFLQLTQTPSALLFTGATAICMIMEPGRALDALNRGGIVWLFVGLGAVSVLWSPVGDIAFRDALEVGLTVGASLTFARALSPSSFLSALMCALLIASIASLLDPRVAINDGALAMIGIFGSKNQFGLSQAMLTLVGAWVLLDRGRSWVMRGLALLSLVVAFFLLIAARSLDSTLVAVGAFACSYFAFTLRRFHSRWRPVILSVAILLVIVPLSVLLVFGSDVDVFGQGLHFFGKDSTLTGRTVLWERAAKMMAENPFLGTGLNGFWVQGNPYAEELWARFQPGRTGFNFHNLWYETGVQFGYVGIAVVLTIIVGTTIAVLRWTLRSATPPTCFFLAFVVFVDIRSFVESELLGQFSLLTVLLVAVRLYARKERNGSVLASWMWHAVGSPKPNPHRAK